MDASRLMRAILFIVSLASEVHELRIKVCRATTNPRLTGQFMSRRYETTLSFMVMPTRRTLPCPSWIPRGIPGIQDSTSRESPEFTILISILREYRQNRPDCLIIKAIGDYLITGITAIATETRTAA